MDLGRGAATAVAIAWLADRTKDGVFAHLGPTVIGGGDACSTSRVKGDLMFFIALRTADTKEP
jgi:hypothetical protein